MGAQNKDDKPLRAKIGENILRLLDVCGATQVELAKFCGTSQGLIADHIRGKSSPKLALLLKYRRFFEQRLKRKVTLYEITGAEQLKGFDEEKGLSKEAIEIARLFERLRPGGEGRRLFLTLLQAMAAEQDAEKRNSDPDKTK